MRLKNFALMGRQTGKMSPRETFLLPHAHPPGLPGLRNFDQKLS